MSWLESEIHVRDALAYFCFLTVKSRHNHSKLLENKATEDKTEEVRTWVNTARAHVGGKPKTTCAVAVKVVPPRPFKKMQSKGSPRTFDEGNNLGNFRSLRCVEFLECAMKLSNFKPPRKFNCAIVVEECLNPLKQAGNRNALEATILNRILDRKCTLERNLGHASVVHLMISFCCVSSKVLTSARIMKYFLVRALLCPAPWPHPCEHMFIFGLRHGVWWYGHPWKWEGNGKLTRRVLQQAQQKASGTI